MAQQCEVQELLSSFCFMKIKFVPFHLTRFTGTCNIVRTGQSCFRICSSIGRRWRRHKLPAMLLQYLQLHERGHSIGSQLFLCTMQWSEWTWWIFIRVRCYSTAKSASASIAIINAHAINDFQPLSVFSPLNIQSFYNSTVYVKTALRKSSVLGSLRRRTVANDVRRSHCFTLGFCF